MGHDLATKLSAIAYVECSAVTKKGLKIVFDEIVSKVTALRAKNNRENGLVLIDPRTITLDAPKPKPSEIASILDPQSSDSKSPEQIARSSTPPPTHELTSSEKPITDKPAAQVLSLPQLLQKSGVTIDEILSEETRGEFLKEFRLRNKLVVEFLSKRQTLSTLISYFGNPEKVQQEQFCACELLTADIAPILGL